ncbi:ornithine cyclodeaminase [Corynebacterium pseudotuberculosis]|uniref:Ornithine cyclodeaminase n=2 Tax=Corynebacterium pseudotuberculosis TaxID=1719 RepID=D9Q978_CORP2|nr:ornithine cyclodeaminase [Corynebacterium pseudotuberculosis]AER68690.1 Ornithine cyclodeaminase [Corynebacterium pseudotuberculosis 1/06-A]ADK28417.1 ornithine cyclodeaminase [Corynebacterium pseudotuberculosis FRC41]ADL10104.1 ornithine cyclodeaminase [Corynebacterium pseudotuberculosis C231]ADL20514.1 ornithine cyclodeaminase [Corynebacterium pseudotuberculosis 1002]AEK91955.1 Ornithine cyclodeaminase [Corynebacterium pseudotuberculosis PAT10]
MISSLRILRNADLSHVAVAPQSVLNAVRTALTELGHGAAECPEKITVKVPTSVNYSMLGRSSALSTVGFKTSFTHWGPHNAEGHREKSYATTLTLYDDTTGAPIAMMDGAPIGALRTPAVSAILAQAVGCNPTTALVIGSGVQGQQAAPFLITEFPALSRLILSGNHPEGLEKAKDLALKTAARLGREIVIDLVRDPAPIACECDLIIGAAGPDTSAVVTAHDLKENATVVVVGYGIDASVCHQAERVVTTSKQQMYLTGTDFADAQGIMPEVTAELPALLAAQTPLRASSGITFCYNSGLVLTDIAVGSVFAAAAIEQNLGVEVDLW